MLSSIPRMSRLVRLSCTHHERNDADIWHSFFVDMRECVGMFCSFVFTMAAI